MSVIIKNMALPKSCTDCPMFDWNEENGSCTATRRRLKAKEEPIGARRADDCPLIELPVQHGRLIDADALQQSIKESIDECHKWADEVEGGEMYARVSQSLGTFVECSLRIKAAPTIIEEEGNK